MTFARNNKKKTFLDRLLLTCSLVRRFAKRVFFTCCLVSTGIFLALFVGMTDVAAITGLVVGIIASQMFFFLANGCEEKKKWTAFAFGFGANCVLWGSTLGVYAFASSPPSSAAPLVWGVLTVFYVVGFPLLQLLFLLGKLGPQQADILHDLLRAFSSTVGFFLILYHLDPDDFPHGWQ